MPASCNDIFEWYSGRVRWGKWGASVATINSIEKTLKGWEPGLKSVFLTHCSNRTLLLNVNLLKVKSKMIYNEFKSKKQTAPSAQIKLNNKYPELSVEWKKIYSLPFTVTLEAKVREFQYKLLNNIVFTNDKLFRFKMIDSPLRAFCQTEVESPEHLFFHCNVTKTFWKSLSSWLIKKIIITFLTLENVLFGVFNAMDDFLILNHLILLAKFYIYKCKLDIKHPSLNVFSENTFQIEQRIASNNDKLDKHYRTWNKVLSCLI